MVSRLVKVCNGNTDLVALPTGRPVSMGIENPTWDMNQTELKDVETLFRENGVSLIIPENQNLVVGDFSGTFTHSPQERAEMLYEAITAKNGDTYLYHNIYLTGGSNTEDVIVELEKNCREKGSLPRRDDLNLFGFSDATQLHHYLGQRGVGRPHYYSQNMVALLHDIVQGNIETVSSFDVDALNDVAKNMDNLTGYTQPGSQAAVEKRLTHQTAFFENEKNFIITELRSKELVDSFLQTYYAFSEEDKKNTVLLLSKDMTDDVKDYLLKRVGNRIPVFSGMPVGHGDCLTDGKAIPLFTSTTLAKNENGGYTIFCDKSKPVPKINLENRRVQEVPNGGQSEIAQVEYINGDSGVVFSNFDEIKRDAENLTIKLVDSSSIKDLAQQMYMAVDTLYSMGILKPECLKSLTFAGGGVASHLVDAKKQQIILPLIKYVHQRDFMNVKFQIEDDSLMDKLNVLHGENSWGKFFLSDEGQTFLDGLRQKNPTLWHVSTQEFDAGEMIRSSGGFYKEDNVSRKVGDVILATNTQLGRDFYALRSNVDEAGNQDTQMLNISLPFGKENQIFLFERMKDVSYEYEVASTNFIPIVSDTQNSLGKWGGQTPIQVVSRKKQTQQEVMQRTTAGVYLILDRNRFLDEMKMIPASFIPKLMKNPQQLKIMLDSFEQKGILERKKSPSMPPKLAALFQSKQQR